MQIKVRYGLDWAHAPNKPDVFLTDLYECCCILIKILLRVVPSGPIKNNPPGLYPNWTEYALIKAWMLDDIILFIVA